MNPAHRTRLLTKRLSLCFLVACRFGNQDWRIPIYENRHGGPFWESKQYAGTIYIEALIPLQNGGAWMTAI